GLATNTWLPRYASDGAQEPTPKAQPALNRPKIEGSPCVTTVSAQLIPSCREWWEHANLASGQRGVGMSVDGKMDVQLDVSKASRVSRLEVIEGPTGRPNRSAAEKAKIAAESLVPGAEVATVARKHAAQLFAPLGWMTR